MSSFPIPPRQAYNSWANQYDTNQNKTRDLEALALRETLAPFSFINCLEIGCGTGKNTVWLATKAKQVTGVDLSEEMLQKAQEKISSHHVQFLQADITEEWSFAKPAYDLISFSLVLEHIENLDLVFRKLSQVIVAGGYVYLGELHPFKQYTGTKARFDTEDGRQVVECYTHHLSDFTQAAKRYGLELININEYFDEGNRTTVSRILALLFRKSE